MPSCTDSSFDFSTWKTGMQRRINTLGSSGSSDLAAIQTEIQSVIDCINGQITKVESSTNTIFNGQYDIADLQKQIETHILAHSLKLQTFH